jgi:hypothetical protein
MINFPMAQRPRGKAVFNGKRALRVGHGGFSKVGGSGGIPPANIFAKFQPVGRNE